jgi:hypothetical protein
VIRETQPSTADLAEDTYHEPPTGVLSLSVIGEDALLKWQPHRWPPDEAPDRLEPPVCEFQVRARSLLLALKAAMEDDAPGSTGPAGNSPAR